MLSPYFKNFISVFKVNENSILKYMYYAKYENTILHKKQINFNLKKNLELKTKKKQTTTKPIRHLCVQLSKTKIILLFY